MNGDAPDEKFDGPSVIIGRGKLGTALASMGMGEDVVLGRGEAIPETLAASSGKGEAEGDGGLMLTRALLFTCPRGRSWRVFFRRRKRYRTGPAVGL